MATAIPAGSNPFPERGAFPPRVATDHNFFLAYVGLIWLAVLAGFGPELVRHLTNHEAPYPIAVHVHAIATVGWLTLLTCQVVLIRRREVTLHRKLGIAGAGLAAGVVVLGFWAALAFEKLALGTPHARPHFLAIEWSNIVEFAGLAAAGVFLRSRSSAHKRLMLLATLSLTPAAFNRAIGKPILHPLLGNGLWETWVQIFAATAILVLGVGLYDWVTRRRLHPAWIAGATWIVAGQWTASWLFYNLAWRTLAASILRAS
jgi:hypothetical protein